jgi:hypothetical protein
MEMGVSGVICVDLRHVGWLFGGIGALEDSYGGRKIGERFSFLGRDGGVDWRVDGFMDGIV